MLNTILLTFYYGHLMIIFCTKQETYSGENRNRNIYVYFNKHFWKGNVLNSLQTTLYSTTDIYIYIYDNTSIYTYMIKRLKYIEIFILRIYILAHQYKIINYIFRNIMFIHQKILVKYFLAIIYIKFQIWESCHLELKYVVNSVFILSHTGMESNTLEFES